MRTLRLTVLALMLCAMNAQALTVTAIGSAIFTTTAGSKSGAPAGGASALAVGDLIVIVCAHTGNTASVAPTDNQADGLGTYSEITASACVKTSSADRMSIWIRNSLIGVASSAGAVTYTHNPGTTTGGGFDIFKVSGMSRTGTSAARQAAKVDNQTASTTPTPVLGVAALTGNALIGAVFNDSNPPALTPRSSPAWTEHTEIAYNSPTTGFEIVFINSGETGTSIAWGSTSATQYCATVVELDASAASSIKFRNRTGSRARMGSESSSR